MIRVAVNGYGTIGKRVADAVSRQPDMTVHGVGKASPDYVAVGAVEAGYPLYAVDADRADAFREAGIDIAGTVDELVAESDVVVDATPAGVGARNRPLYDRLDTPAVFQGGEDAAVADVSFNARANFEAATRADAVRVVSCNTTGLARLLAPLRESYGIEKARVTLVRRGGDPNQPTRGPIDAVVPDPVTLPSHHGADVQTIFPELSIDTIGLKVPTTAMHVHAVNVTLEREPEDAAALGDRLAAEDRLLLLPGYAAVDGTGQLKDLAQDAGRPRGDVWENAIWEESLSVRGRDCYLLQAIHQEADVVPENVDAIRALAGRDAAESVALTNETLGIGLDRFDSRRGRAADEAAAD